MIEQLVDARRFAAGLVQTALAAPLGLDGRPRTIGPFALVAHALPFEVAPGALPVDFDVRPHPHLGLAAATYVIEGHVTHRDSLGSRHELGPGAIDHMVAGRGVVHSERFERLRLLGGRLELFQLLLALPDGGEDVEPSFAAFDPARVPARAGAGATVRVLADPGDDAAPLRHVTPIVLCDVTLAPGARYEVPAAAQRAVYVLSGAVELAGARVGAQQTAVLAAGPAVVAAAEPARLLVFGGEPVGPRYLWWNFLHSSLDRIEEAKAAWREGRTPLPPGDTESFTPAPPDHGRPLFRLNGAG